MTSTPLLSSEYLPYASDNPNRHTIEKVLSLFIPVSLEQMGKASLMDRR